MKHILPKMLELSPTKAVPESNAILTSPLGRVTRWPERHRLPALIGGLLLCIVSLIGEAASVATSGPGVPYPASPPDAEETARQVYYVNHLLALRNARIGDKKHPMVLIDWKGKGAPRVMTMVRHLNNDYQDGEIRARDLAIFRSGKLKGTGILVTDYTDPDKRLSFSVWLPALRKIRRHAEPDQNDSWGGSLFTYGDIYLRRPNDERHELLSQAPFNDCLQPLVLPEAKRNRYTRQLPEPRCDLKGTSMLRLQSHTRFAHWWYDHRIVWVDPETFADYRSEYFKDGKKIKVIDKDWRSMGLDAPRAQYWLFWSGRHLLDGRQGMAFVPEGHVYWNEEVNPKTWTESTLRRIKR